MTEHFVILMIRLIMKEFKELNSLIVHALISRIEVGYRDNPWTIKIYYKFIDDSISN